MPRQQSKLGSAMSQMGLVPAATATTKLRDVRGRWIWICLDRYQVLLNCFECGFRGDRKQPKDVQILVLVHLDVEDLRIACMGALG